MKQKARLIALDRDAEKMMKWSLIRHFKLGTESGDEAIQERCRGGSEDYVIDIEKEVCQVSSRTEDKERVVIAALFETQTFSVGGKACVPGARCLFQAIGRAFQ